MTKEKCDSSLAKFQSSCYHQNFFQTKTITVRSVLFFSWCSCNALSSENLKEFCFQTQKTWGKQRLSEVIWLRLNEATGRKQLLFPLQQNLLIPTPKRGKNNAIQLLHHQIYLINSGKAISSFVGSFLLVCFLFFSSQK